MNIDFLWSKGFNIINKYAYLSRDLLVNNKETHEIVINEINNCKDILWFRLTNQYYPNISDLDLFVNNIHLLNKPVFLLTTDGDRSVPSSYSSEVVNAILDNKYIKAWYTQNYDKSIIHPKLKFFPIGLDLHTQRWWVNNSIQGKLDFMFDLRKHKTNKITNKIFSDTHLTPTHNERKILFNKIKDNKSIFFLQKSMSYVDISRMYNNFLFVLSPRGLGLDAHRTWELFLLGCIVIKKTSPIDDMFINNNLPVVILNDWDDLNHDIENKLIKWREKYIQLTSIENIYPKFKYSYWIK